MADESQGPGGSGGTGAGGPRVIPIWKQRNFLIGAGVIVLILIGTVTALALSGDDGESEAEPATSAPTTGETTVPTTEPGEEPPIAPLTGLPDDSLESLTRPALLAKIDNVNLGARPPQAGIDIADVVWEEPVEGTTRLLAVWQSRSPERIGPIRSTRFIDAGLAWPFGNVPYIYSGGTPPKVAAINESPVQTFDETALLAVDARVRDPAFSAPHNLFALPDNVWAAANDKTPPAPLFTYLAAGQPFPGEPVGKVELPNLSRATYTWDEGSGSWLREELTGGSGDVVAHVTESGEQVAPTNLIVQRIAGLTRDDVLGEGDAWVLSQGQMAAVRWERATLEDRTTFLYEDGSEVELTPGSTWIHLILEGEPQVLPAVSP